MNKFVTHNDESGCASRTKNLIYGTDFYTTLYFCFLPAAYCVSFFVMVNGARCALG